MRFQDKVALITAAGERHRPRHRDNHRRARAASSCASTTTRAARPDGRGRGRRGRARATASRADALDAAQVEARTGGRSTHTAASTSWSTPSAAAPSSAAPAAVDQLSFAEWQKLIDFNLTGTFLFTHAVVPVMKRQRSGKIVNLSSVAGRGLSLSSSSAYAAAKGGIIAFTRKLAFELGPHGINVNAIAPSLTLTERIRPRWDRRPRRAAGRDRAHPAAAGWPTPADQARVICFLASSDADFVTGVTIDVTGGQ